MRRHHRRLGKVDVCPERHGVQVDADDRQAVRDHRNEQRRRHPQPRGDPQRVGAHRPTKRRQLLVGVSKLLITLPEHQVDLAGQLGPVGQAAPRLLQPPRRAFNRDARLNQVYRAQLAPSDHLGIGKDRRQGRPELMVGRLQEPAVLLAHRHLRGHVFGMDH